MTYEVDLDSPVILFEVRNTYFLFAILILYIIIVKVHSFKLTEFNRGVDPELNPTTIKLYVNRESMGFEDCEDIEPTQIFELTGDDLKEGAKPLLLKYVKFQRVRSITIFIEDNEGGEITALGMLKFFGRPIGTCVILIYLQ